MLLKGCLESLSDESQGVRLETIVVDNASADGAADMVDRDFPHVRLVRNNHNVGFSRANNQAAREAQGRFLFFLNNDTCVPPRALGRLVSYLEENPEVGIVGPRLRDGEGQVQISYRPRPTLAALLHRTCLFRWTGLFRRSYKQYRRWHFDAQRVQSVEVLMGAAMLVRRDRFLELGGWDEDFHFGGEDLELCYRVNQQAPVIYYPEVEITHLGRASTRQNIAFAATRIAIGLVQYLRKTGCSRAGIFCFKLAVTLDAPLQLVGKSAQHLWRRLLGKHKKAQQSRLIVHGLAHFLGHGLVPFWKA